MINNDLIERLDAEAKIWPRSDISGLLKEASAAIAAITQPKGDDVTDSMLNKAMDTFNDVTMLGGPTRSRMRAALESVLRYIEDGTGCAMFKLEDVTNVPVVWVDPYELMMVREHGGMIVATHEAEPESKRTQGLYYHAPIATPQPAHDAIAADLNKWLDAGNVIERLGNTSVSETNLYRYNNRKKENE